MPILCYGNMSNLQKKLYIGRYLQNFMSFFTYKHQFLYMVSKLKHCNFFLMQGINLFLPIEKVCSKLNFPPAPEAERNRQCLDPARAGKADQGSAGKCHGTKVGVLHGCRFLRLDR